MTSLVLPNNWAPREYQLPAWRKLDAGIKKALLVWHRRAGKDDVCLHFAATQVLQRTGNYWHMLPEYAQARKSVWEAVNPHTGMRRIDEAFPSAMRKSTRDTDMRIEFLNGSSWQLVGSDRFDSLVGSPPIGVTASEWALADPKAWAYLRPILRENGGWAVFITTPRGRNHVYKMYQAWKDDPECLVQLLSAKDTKVMTDAQLAAEKLEYQKLYGYEDGEALFRQEYLCDFEAAIVGAYFARQISEAKDEGRITAVPYDASALVHTSWDLGMSDSTAIWFYQLQGGKIRVIDYLAENSKQLGWYAQELMKKPYAYAQHNLPHDANIVDMSGTGGLSRVEVLRSMLGNNVVIVPRVEHKADAVAAIRSVLPRCEFDEKKCELGIDALAQYRRKWDDERKIYLDRPLHDWTSHGVDAFDGMARTINIASSVSGGSGAYKRRGGVNWRAL